MGYPEGFHPLICIKLFVRCSGLCVDGVRRRSESGRVSCKLWLICVSVIGTCEAENA